MASNDSTATLFSTYKKSKLGRAYSRNTSSSSRRYIVGSVGRSCGKHTKFDGSGSEICTASHNVAIATQVLNPSAIGGSLKGRRFMEHFGPREDDQVSFLSRKSRAVCGKVCYYAISIGVTILLITGLIVALGYMQSEKHRIATRPVKLAQGQAFQERSTTELPSPILYGTTTTERHAEHSDSENEIEDEEDDMDEIGVEDGHTEIQGHHDLHGLKSSTHPHKHLENFHFQQENTIAEEDDKKYGFNDGHHQFSEVRVKPPSDYKFNGISFGFPIYRTNKTSPFGFPYPFHPPSSHDEEDDTETESATTTSPDDDDTTAADIPVVVTETKELETNNLHVQIGSSNFTSLIDSDEEEDEKKERDDEALFEEKSLKNYANAAEADSIGEQENNSPLFSSDFSENRNSLSSAPINIFLNSRYNSSETDDSSLLSTNNGKFNNGNFAIDDFTNPPPQLQTDIFDNEEQLQTSASSEESEIDFDESNDPPTIRQKTTTNRPRSQTTKNNRQKNTRPSGHSNSRRGKVLLKSQQSEHNADRNDYETANAKGTAKGSTPKPTFNKKFRVGHSKGHQDSSLTLPILDYRVDFAKFMSTTPPPSSSSSLTTTASTLDDTDIIEYQPPTTLPNTPYPNFKFGSPSAAADGGGGAPFDLEEYLNKHAKKDGTQQIDLAPVSSPLTSGNNANAFTGPTTFPQSQFSPQPTTGNFAAATPTGATLNLFQPQQSFNNFETGNSPIPNYNFGNIQQQNPYQSHSPSYNLNPAGSYNFNTVDLPYPNHPGARETLGNTFQNAFSFSNSDASQFAPSSPNKVVLTTGSGQVPNYNTITQGIHLLTLLSGKSTGEGFQQNDNQHSSSSAFSNTDYSSSSGLDDSNNLNHFLKGIDLSSLRNAINPSAVAATTAASTLQRFGVNFYNPQQQQNNFKVFSGFGGDQDSSASEPIPSFRKNIVLKGSDLRKLVKDAIQTSASEVATTTPSSSPPPKSFFALNILPKSMRKPSTENSELTHKSRKRLMIVDDDMQVGESRPFKAVVTSTSKPPSPPKTRFPSSSSPIRGLKSGFFT